MVVMADQLVNGGRLTSLVVGDLLQQGRAPVCSEGTRTNTSERSLAECVSDDTATGCWGALG